MSKRSTLHNTFVIERTFNAPPARVFNAFADQKIKARWFGDAEHGESDAYKLDFRVGGQEHAGGGAPGGPVYTYEATFRDIVPNERIVSTYDMYMDKTRISVSLATLELTPAGSGTRLLLTEQGVYLDELDTPESREKGTRGLLDALGKALERETAKA